MNTDYNTVNNAKEVLSSRGMKVEIRECVPGLGAYQLVVTDIPGIKHYETEKAIEQEFGVSAVMVISDDEEYAFLDLEDEDE
ncbi:MAG: hypothetical protein IPL26_30185 [Leptospiraceae bacterium]|nr:hypothetical protein [Leptospiraceae bacterium]